MSGSEEVEVREWNAAPGRHLDLQDAISGGEHVLKLRGELDIASAADVEAAVVRVCASPVQSVTLDLSELSFIDSSGLRAIISASKRCRELALDFRLIPGPRAVQGVFELTGLLDRMPFDSAAHAGDAQPGAA